MDLTIAKEELISSFYARAHKSNHRIVFPEGESARIIQAVEKMIQEQLCQPVLLTAGKPLQCSAATEVIDTVKNPRSSLFAEQLAAMKYYRDQEVDKLVQHPLIFAALLIKNHYAQAGIGGARFATSELLHAGLRIIGKAAGVETISSSFLMLGNERVLSFADCAIVVEPSPEQLTDIALSTVQTHRLLSNEEPRVAFLSFSTKGSAQHPQVSRVQEAVKIFKSKAADIVCDGELQLDAALVPAIAKRKSPRSPLQGNANILIFPNLASGNIAYKLAERLGGMQAIGPLVQGLAAPFMDLSRGCTYQDIILLSCITSLLLSNQAKTRLDK